MELTFDFMLYLFYEYHHDMFLIYFFFLFRIQQILLWETNLSIALGIPPTSIYCLNRNIAFLQIESCSGTLFSKQSLIYSIIISFPSAQANSSNSMGNIIMLCSSKGIRMSFTFSFIDIKKLVSSKTY